MSNGVAMGMDELSEEELARYVFFNGIDGASGEPLSPAVERAKIGENALQAPVDLTKPERDELQQKRVPPPDWGSEAENPEDLEEAGWGVIFAADDPQTAKILEALSPLLASRRQEAGANYREYIGNDGYVQGETAHRWLARHGVGPGPAVSGMVPYYLLIVGDPLQIPFDFQHGLDVQYAVGRIHFDIPDEYRSYADSVVQAEAGQIVREARAAFFGVRNPGDAATQLSAQYMVQPLAEELGQRVQAQNLDWRIDSVPVLEATKPRLMRLLGGDDTPALLFTASHGAIFPPEDAERRGAELGALVCGEWSNRRGRFVPLTPDMVVRAADVGPNQSVGGLIAFHFACFGLGMPARDSFEHLGSPSKVLIGPNPALAPLPKRLLGHPNGSALAVIGHVDRALPSSFYWPDVPSHKAQLAVYRAALWLLMKGHRVGFALEHLNMRYAELSTRVSEALDARNKWKEVAINEETNAELANLWLANNDARNYAIMGDPAVRAAVGGPAADADDDRPSVIFRPQTGAERSFASVAIGMASRDTSLQQQSAGATPAPARSTAGPVAVEGMSFEVAPEADAAQGAVTVSTWQDVDGTAEKRVLKARTVISPDGDVDNYLPKGLTKRDALYLEAHRAIVGETLAARLAARRGPANSRSG